MNQYQQIWWEQVQADYQTFLLLQTEEAPACHQLLFLQMVTEKLGKAYYWRNLTAPPASHLSFVRFLQALVTRSRPDRERIADLLGFRTARGLENFVRALAPIAYAIERLAPALAGDGPNPEYPWPQKAPTTAPCHYRFPIFDQITGSGRQLLKVVGRIIEVLPEID